MGRSSDVVTSSKGLVVSETLSSTKFPVFLAKSTVDASEYIIKAFTKDSSSISSYSREKQILSSLDHPNIIHYIPEYQIKVRIPDRSCIVMEYAPYGDFFNLIMDIHLKNEKLIRTYFHHLIEGLEHLHSKGIAHLDIKLENLLLGKDFLLKIADFDVAQNIEDNYVLSQGTINYRAPELRIGTCRNYEAADVYSAGVCLFALVSRAFPFLEEGDEITGKLNRYSEFLSKNERFWKKMETLTKTQGRFSPSLKELLNGMWAFNPDDRLTLKEIKKSRWYNGPVYQQNELEGALADLLK